MEAHSPLSGLVYGLSLSLPLSLTSPRIMRRRLCFLLHRYEMNLFIISHYLHTRHMLALVACDIDRTAPLPGGEVGSLSVRAWRHAELGGVRA